jgi:NAD(P)H-hydrate epimerase
MHYNKLVEQCRLFNIPILDRMPPRPGLSNVAADEQNIEWYSGIIDAIFGFSFKGEAREPFKSCIDDMMYAQRHFKTIVVSVDVPSGWDVDQGDVTETGFHPDVLVSLTAPKLCTRFFQGRHYVGGRFLPKSIAAKYDIEVNRETIYDDRSLNICENISPYLP